MEYDRAGTPSAAKRRRERRSRAAWRHEQLSVVLGRQPRQLGSGQRLWRRCPDRRRRQSRSVTWLPPGCWAVLLASMVMVALTAVPPGASSRSKKRRRSRGGGKSWRWLISGSSLLRMVRQQVLPLRPTRGGGRGKKEEEKSTEYTFVRLSSVAFGHFTHLLRTLSSGPVVDSGYGQFSASLWYLAVTSVSHVWLRSSS